MKVGEQGEKIERRGRDGGESKTNPYKTRTASDKPLLNNNTPWFFECVTSPECDTCSYTVALHSGNT